MKKYVIISAFISTGLISLWYFDVWHNPVEPIDELIGQNYDYAHKFYFKTEPDHHYTINIRDQLNIFDGGIYGKEAILIDSLVDVFTWNSWNYKETIWIGKTSEVDYQIIDAIRYKNDIKF